MFTSLHFALSTLEVAYQAMLARDAGRGAGAAQFHSKPLVPMD